MDSDQGKLFIGGISWETNEDRLKDYFGNYGEVLQTVIMRDKISGRPRGFGFVVFADPSVLDRVLQDKHVLDGRTVRFGPNPSLDLHFFCGFLSHSMLFLLGLLVSEMCAYSYCEDSTSITPLDVLLSSFPLWFSFSF